MSLVPRYGPPFQRMIQKRRQDLEDYARITIPGLKEIWEPLEEEAKKERKRELDSELRDVIIQDEEREIMKELEQERAAKKREEVRKRQAATAPMHPCMMAVSIPIDVNKKISY